MDRLALTPWLDPSQWTEADWAAIGVLIALLAFAFGVYQWWRSQRSKRPKIAFGSLRLLGPGLHSRPAYEHAIELTIHNVGERSAVYVNISVADPRVKSDPDRALFAEHYGAPALGPNASLTDHLGIRGLDQADNPSSTEVQAFYERCVAFAQCWDDANNFYVFTPGGGGRVPRRKRDWDNPMQQRQALESAPSRGAAPRSLGLGQFDE